MLTKKKVFQFWLQRKTWTAESNHSFCLVPTSEFREAWVFPGDGRGIEDGGMDSLSSGDPNTAGLLAAMSVLATVELLALLVMLLLLAPHGIEFQIRAPGQQIAIVWRTELSDRTSAWCCGHVLYCDSTGRDWGFTGVRDELPKGGKDGWQKKQSAYLWPISLELI